MLHLDGKPVPAVFQELEDAGLYQVNFYVRGHILQYAWIINRYDFLTRLSHAVRIRAELEDLIAALPPHFRPHFSQHPSLMDQPEELFFMFKTVGREFVHYLFPFLNSAALPVVDGVQAMAEEEGRHDILGHIDSAKRYQRPERNLPRASK